MFFIVLSCLLVIFIFTDTFDLSVNSLTGTIPSQIAMMSTLCESSVVWLLVAMIVLSRVFHCTLLLACHFYFYRYIGSLHK
jgi:ABC-type xylose transport system permease subunit